MTPGNYPLAGDRWTALVELIPFIGWDFTGAVFAAQVRLTPDATGAALVDLATVGSASAEGLRLVYAGTATIAAHIAAGRLQSIPPGYQSSDSVLLSLVGIRINETTMEGLPFPAERGDDPVLAWDIHITPSAGIKQKYLGGSFTVRAGVTQ